MPLVPPKDASAATMGAFLVIGAVQKKDVLLVIIHRDCVGLVAKKVRSVENFFL